MTDPIATAWDELDAAERAYHTALGALDEARAVREQAILALIKHDVGYREIARHTTLSHARVGQIGQAHGTPIRKAGRPRTYKLDD